MRTELTNLYPFYKQYRKDIKSGVAEEKAKAILFQSKAFEDYEFKKYPMREDERADAMALLAEYFKPRGGEPWSPLE